MMEFDFIRDYLVQQYNDDELVLGVGDDAAVIRPVVGKDIHISSDMLLADRHFFRDVSPADLAHKILAVNVSDMAAMGAAPRWFLLSVALPELNREWLKVFCDHLFSCASRFGVTLIGGDTTKGDWVFNVTILGETPSGEALLRSGAKVHDDVWVSGQLGLAAAALDVHWKKTLLPSSVYSLCEQKRLQPEPRVALGLTLRRLAHAAQDVSDGLAQDLGHILRASHLSAQLWADQLPTLPELAALIPQQKISKEQLYTWMLAGGDDYELVFTADASQRQAIIHAAQTSQTAVTRIGTLVEDNPEQPAHVTILDEQQHIITLNHQGFDHFA